MRPMLDGLLCSAVDWLKGQGIAAGKTFPARAVDRSGSFLRLGVKSARAASGALGCYLGLERLDDGGEREVYGLKCELELGIDAYCAGSPGGCVLLMEKALEALGRMPGLGMRGFHMGESAPDGDSGMFRCSGGLDCALMLKCASGVGKPEFRDFVLEGELSK